METVFVIAFVRDNPKLYFIITHYMKSEPVRIFVRKVSNGALWHLMASDA